MLKYFFFAGKSAGGPEGTDANSIQVAKNHDQNLAFGQLFSASLAIPFNRQHEGERPHRQQQQQP